MMPYFFHRKAASSWKELSLVLGVLAILLALPPIALLTMTDAKALVSDTSGSTLYTDPAVQGDAYDYGNCTYWAALRRTQIGERIPNTWGNAATWAIRALLDGYVVDHVPSYGAIMQTPNAAGGLGHVAFIESVDPATGSWTISEMNHLGWDETDTRTFPASLARNYSFIHERR